MNEETKTLIKLTNPKFTFQFGDQEYQIRRANMNQMIQFEQRANELIKNEDLTQTARDLKMLAYGVFLLIKEADNAATEQFVEDNVPGGMDSLSILVDLGFIDPSKLEMVRRAQEKLITLNSSQISATEQDGLQSKSAG